MVKTRKKMEADRETKEDVSKKRAREEEKEENDIVMVKRRCVNLVSITIFSSRGGFGELW